jgi:hypothetical protein
VSIFRELEKRIDERLRKLFAAEDASVQGRELIEIQRAIIEEIEDRAQLLPRARRRLGYNDLKVRIAAPDEDRQVAVRMVFAEGNALRTAILDHLRSEDIEAPVDLDVTVEAIADAPAEVAAKGFHIVYSLRESPAKESAAVKGVGRPSVRFTVLHGDAEQQVYELTRSRIHLGRLREVLDERRRPVRRNDVVFNESPEKPNSTVSRAHAHIEYDEGSRDFRLFDDGSAYGTSVVHEGRLVNVPPAGARGQRITTGDEIYLGQARVLFEVL